MKTRDSARAVPVHDELIRLGFLDFARAKGASDELLFGELRSTGGKRPLADTAARHFGRLLDRVLPQARASKTTFHSFRAYVNTALAAAGVSDAARERIMGHKAASINSLHYVKNLDLRAFIENCQFTQPIYIDVNFRRKMLIKSNT